MPRKMTLMYIQDGGFQPPKVEGLLPHSLVLHWMMTKTLAPDSYQVGSFRHWPCSCFFRRWWWGIGRRRWRGDRGWWVAGFASMLHSSFPFLVSWRQRGRRELSLLVFFILMWFVIWTRICFMCGLWYFKWLVKHIMLIWYYLWFGRLFLSIYLCSMFMKWNAWLCLCIHVVLM
jgi:hypothetical protein